VDVVHRDLPGALRAEGLTLATIERFTVTTPVWPLRTWIRARVVRVEPRSGDGSGS
jgi:hypothetical protein